MLLSAVARLHIFFFFQAEDGIRDRTVTGVQTCALPICLSIEQVPEWAAQSVVGEGLPQLLVLQGVRSEERRVGKECRSRGWQAQYKNNTKSTNTTVSKSNSSFFTITYSSTALLNMRIHI